MKLHIITVGEPKLPYAKAGWDEYRERLRHYHTVRVTHLPNKWAYDTAHFIQAAGNAYKVVLAIEGNPFTSPGLADFLEKREQGGREVCFIIGGPEGLPKEVLDQSDLQWSLSPLTFPHDLAMVILLESLYRASTIRAGQPYHK